MTTLPTPAGQTEAPGARQVDALNAVFSLFRVNYHNQYYKAFPDTETLNTTKRLWLNSLKSITPDRIRAAGEQLVRQNEFLPTLAQMLQLCCSDAEGNPLPDARSAFLEACNKPSPKAEQQWSHPIVYQAGRLTGWHRLASAAENQSFPWYERQYRQLVERLMRGEAFELPGSAQGDPEQEEAAVLNRQAGRERLAELQKILQSDEG